jgi:hypothetical protein
MLFSISMFALALPPSVGTQNLVYIKAFGHPQMAPVSPIRGE